MTRWTKVFSTFLLFFWSIAGLWLLMLWLHPTLFGRPIFFWICIALALLALPFAWVGARLDQRDQAHAELLRSSLKMISASR
jgi:uncharacterized membrane protein